MRCAKILMRRWLRKTEAYPYVLFNFYADWATVEHVLD